MDNIAKGLNMLLAPIGMKARTLIIDYTDKDGVDNCVIVYPALNCDNDYIVSSLVVDYFRCGCTVTQITELLDGYGYDEMKKKAQTKPKEAAKHIKILYYAE